MKRLLLTIPLLLLLCTFFGSSFSRNNIIKFSAANVKNFELIADYQSIEIFPEFIQATAESNAWLQTYPVDIGNDFVPNSVFVNFTSERSNSGVILQVRDSQNDNLIREKFFYKSGKMDLVNIFNKHIYLNLDILGSDIRIFSYGIVRKPEVIITSNEALILPEVLFFDESSLNIDFFLHFPAYLDIILFDNHGNVIDYVAKSAFYKEGQNSLIWEPLQSQSKTLKSGPHYIYFKVRSIDGKIVEITKKFLFVKE
jgi:hypothetical protein